MLRFLMWLILLATAAGAYVLTSSQPQLTQYREMLEKLLKIQRENLSAEALQRGTMDHTNFSRQTEKLALLQFDPEMQSWLDAADEATLSQDLNSLVKSAQNQLPRYMLIVATQVTGDSVEEVTTQLHGFLSHHAERSQLSHLAARPVRSSAKPQAVLLAGQRLTDFTPEALTTRKTNTFFAICPHCKNQQACRVPPAQRGISLDCPKCERSYGMLAADREGRFRYANEYLTGYAPPAVFPTDTAPLHTLYTIWGAVRSACRYVKDTDERMPGRDVWQTGLETLTLGQGDCEDSSILLADWLLSRGIRTRVAIGRYGDIGGHAWCVSQIDGIDYLLESTEGRPDPSKPPYAADVGIRYLPDILFDRDALYVRSVPKGKWEGDYWSAKYWTRVQPRLMFKPTKMGYTAYAAPPPEPLFRVVTSPVYSSTTAAPNLPLATHFHGIKAIPKGAPQWQVSNFSSFVQPPAEGPKLTLMLEGAN
jgi:hypothetical protein